MIPCTPDSYKVFECQNPSDNFECARQLENVLFCRTNAAPNKSISGNKSTLRENNIECYWQNHNDQYSTDNIKNLIVSELKIAKDVVTIEDKHLLGKSTAKKVIFLMTMSVDRVCGYIDDKKLDEIIKYAGGKEHVIILPIQAAEVTCYKTEFNQIPIITIAWDWGAKKWIIPDEAMKRLKQLIQ
jgi:hypothetical protein